MNDSTDPRRLLAARMEACANEIGKIVADAERRADPLRLQMERYRIAIEVLSDVLPRAHGSVPVKHVDVDTGAKPSIRKLLMDEFHRSALPLSKTEMLDRLRASGHTDLRDGTVGSTLSKMLAAGLLTKDGSNRYAVKTVDVKSAEDEIDLMAGVEEEAPM